MSQMNSFLKHTILVVFTALFLFGSSCSSTYKKTIADTYCKRSKKPEKVLIIHEGSYGHINFIYQKDSKEFLQFIDNALKRYFNAINIHYDKQKKYYTYNYSTFQNTTYLDASDYSKKKKINKMHKNIILKYTSLFSKSLEKLKHPLDRDPLIPLKHIRQFKRSLNVHKDIDQIIVIRSFILKDVVKRSEYNTYVAAAGLHGTAAVLGTVAQILAAAGGSGGGGGSYSGAPPSPPKPRDRLIFDLYIINSANNCIYKNVHFDRPFINLELSDKQTIEMYLYKVLENMWHY